MALRKKIQQAFESVTAATLYKDSWYCDQGWVNILRRHKPTLFKDFKDGSLRKAVNTFLNNEAEDPNSNFTGCVFFTNCPINNDKRNVHFFYYKDKEEPDIPNEASKARCEWGGSFSTLNNRARGLPKIDDDNNDKNNNKNNNNDKNKRKKNNSTSTPKRRSSRLQNNNVSPITITPTRNDTEDNENETANNAAVLPAIYWSSPHSNQIL